ncbi:MAG: hypothetical protein ACLS5G_02550 [Streptococcus sp.]
MSLVLIWLQCTLQRGHYSKHESYGTLVKGVTLRDGDQVIGAFAITEDQEVLIITRKVTVAYLSY